MQRIPYASNSISVMRNVLLLNRTCTTHPALWTALFTLRRHVLLDPERHHLEHQSPHYYFIARVSSWAVVWGRKGRTRKKSLNYGHDIAQ